MKARNQNHALGRCRCGTTTGEHDVKTSAPFTGRDALIIAAACVAVVVWALLAWIGLYHLVVGCQ